MGRTAARSQSDESVEEVNRTHVPMPHRRPAPRGQQELPREPLTNVLTRVTHDIHDSGYEYFDQHTGDSAFIYMTGAERGKIVSMDVHLEIGTEDGHLTRKRIEHRTGIPRAIPQASGSENTTNLGSGIMTAVNSFRSTLFGGQQVVLELPPPRAQPRPFLALEGPRDDASSSSRRARKRSANEMDTDSQESDIDETPKSPKDKGKGKGKDKGKGKQI
ncbi:hypothetical protein NX059_012400 [Plenodomus lindquistii]|nr:hypothetical protein NX059_012400 [Plenodomus lindquistii]